MKRGRCIHSPCYRTSSTPNMPLSQLRFLSSVMSSASFDEYVAAGCPVGVDWYADDAKRLSIRNIADWCYIPRDNFDKLMHGITLFTRRAVDLASTELGLAPVPSNSSLVKLPVRATLMWSRRQWADHFMLRRTMLWRLVLAQDDEATADKSAFTLFTPVGLPAYTLTPKQPARWYIPMQQTHTGPLAIPPDLADISCSSLSPLEIVDKLNAVLGAQRVLEPEPKAFIQDCVSRKWDLGKLYGSLRLWWRLEDDFGTCLAEMTLRIREWQEMYPDSSLKSPYIYTPNKIPPRRVWDLYSNRVLPFYLIFNEWTSLTPSNVWAVSHSWVSDSERQSVITSINAYGWPVPIPVDTTLDHVRIELLNMGAEYVFLDVLCLRQQGDPARERLRQKEWEVDVPTLMNVYRRHKEYQTTVIYFNGLGLPLDMSSEVLDSTFHWFKRAWTLQETTENWLPGGLTNPLRGGASGGYEFIRLMRRSIETMKPENRSLMDLVYAFQERPGVAEKAAHDRVAALSYLVPTQVRPKYYSSTGSGGDVDGAWALFTNELLQQFETYKAHLLDLLVRCPTAREDHWVPHWQMLMAPGERVPKAEQPYATEEMLFKAFRWPCTYVYHYAYVMEGCFGASPNGDPRTIVVRLPQNPKRCVHIQVFADLPPGKTFTLVGLADSECWIVGENKGEGIVGTINTSEPTLLLKKFTVGRVGSVVERMVLRHRMRGGVRPVAYWNSEMDHQLRAPPV